MQNKHHQQGFTQSVLPWAVAAGALVLYLVTLNHWVNIHSLPVVAKIAGWDWTPFVQMPLLYFITFPLRLLPTGIQPLALNILSACFAASAMGLLARSVALLPHDRTHEQRLRERSEFSLLSTPTSWVPPLFAALALSFQLTMWENSTALTGESLDLLLFAYLIRCLLEYRLTQNDSWLSKFALVYGLGIPNNYSLIAYIPAFLGALIWIRGKKFFRAAFLARMAGLALLGLLLYLALPLVWQLKGQGTYTFWEVLKANLVSQKTLVFDPQLRSRVLILSLTSVLPVIMMGIRWPSSFGETNAAGAAITNVMFRLVHIVFLIAGAATMLDPKFSPRKLGWGLPFLSLYYLTAISIGYYSGYVLLVFTDPAKKNWQRQSDAMRFFNPVFRMIVWAGLIVLPILLITRNFSAVKANDGSILQQFTRMSAEGVSEGSNILLSEDPFQLSLLEGWFSRDGTKRKHILLNTRMLEIPNYHKQLSEVYGSRWPVLPEEDRIAKTVSQDYLLQIMTGLARTNHVIYLHPSFGYYFENLYPEPHGVVYSMKVFPKEMLLPPNASSTIMQENETFWKNLQQLESKLEPLIKKDVADAKYVGAYYSRAMNTWGVELQKIGKTTEAARYFENAMQLNTNNVPALVNFRFNQQKFNATALKQDLQKEIEDKFGHYRSWESIMGDNGPFDEPEFCYKLGSIFESQSLVRQALEQFIRSTTLSPTNFAAKSALAGAYLALQRPDKVFDVLEDARKLGAGLTKTNQMELAAIEAATYFAQTNYVKAEDLLIKAIAQYPKQRALMETLSEMYKASGQPQKSLGVIDQMLADDPNNVALHLQKADLYIGLQNYPKANGEIDTVLRKSPDNVPALLYRIFITVQTKDYKEGLSLAQRIEKIDEKNLQATLYRGVFELNLKSFDKAVDTFSRVLAKDPNSIAALQNRAVANLQAGHLDSARKDYEALRKIRPTAHQVYFGLGEIAYKEKDKPAAIRNYELYLKYVPAQASDDLATEKKQVTDRLAELKTASR
jgi:tetratricopeptide (TPR) repeat protein